MACNSFGCKYFKVNKCRRDRKNPCSCTRNSKEGCSYVQELLRNNEVLCAGCKNATCEAGYLYFLELSQNKCKDTSKDAETSIEEIPLSFKTDEEKEPEKTTVKNIATTLPATAYVDGSFNSNTNTYGYGLVMMVGLDTYEYYGSNNNPEVAKIRNVAGELLGAMTSVQKAKKYGCKSLIICYDYEGIEKWVTGAWKTNNEFTSKYKSFMQGCGLNLRFKKVKAHSGECYNEQADKLAKKAVGV